VEQEGDSGIRARGEEALSELAQAIAENPLVGGALARALGAGERAAVAQRQALGALNLASTSDFERLELRLRSFASRLEALEDSIDDLRDEIVALKASGSQPGAQGAEG
jgi:chromosome segregation ATPase